MFKPPRLLQVALLDKYCADVTKLESKLSAAEQELKQKAVVEQSCWTLKSEVEQLKHVHTQLEQEKAARSQAEAELGRLRSCLTLHSEAAEYVEQPLFDRPPLVHSVLSDPFSVCV
jgi:predicted RNase H-like nuclease (RuvC/YqgF family)